MTDTPMSFNDRQRAARAQRLRALLDSSGGIEPMKGGRGHDQVEWLAWKMPPLLVYLGVGMSTRFDYDRVDIHTTYASVRALTRERRDVWAKILRRELDGIDVRRIVDLGCGVGRFSPLLREVFRGAVVGIDRSERMLAAARAIPEAETISWIRASAEALPLAEGNVDLIFLFLVYHHLADPLAALRECARILTDNGAVFIVNSTSKSLTRFVGCRSFRRHARSTWRAFRRARR